MSNRSKIAKGAVAAVAGVATLAGAAAVPSFAAAQTGGYYDSRGGYYYDPCRRDQTNRSTTGALLGAAVGAMVGSNAAARGVRTEGALLGGALGAAAGAAIGNNGAACTPGRTSTPQYGQPYGQYGAPQQHGYYGSSYPANSGYYGSSYDTGRYGYGATYDYGQAYDRYGRSYPIAQRPSADGCSIAESPIYMPDGSTQKRFVRVCRDSSGRYQVVD
ncbi:hypothetical protein [Phenylobacterium sp.]|jgi:hypothetical protein|uniref:hypothetical protein n=1 Tax=Phenylobacterium sp. TaxID=1871053 RepID=UPI002FDB6DD0